MNTEAPDTISVSAKQNRHVDQRSTNQLCGCYFYPIHPLLHLWQTSLIDHDIPTEYKLGHRISLNTLLLGANADRWHFGKREENYLT